MANEIVIKGGTVVDGSGAPGVRADVGIADGRIVEIGPDLTGDRVLDATGCVVAPGFIDIHTHFDAQVFWDPALTPSCYHGVTTVVAGNCGFTIAPTRPEGRDLIARTLENVEDMDFAVLAAGIPWDFETFAEYMASIERRGVGLNWAAYAGHTSIRLYAMGEEAYDRVATPDEIVRMQHILRESLEAGAAGFATSFGMPHHGVDGKPVPSRLADQAEFEAMLDVMSDWGRGVVDIVPGPQCLPADMADLQLRTGVPFTWGALLTHPSGYHRQTAEMNAAGWARGAEVWPQVTPRPLTFQFTVDAPYPWNVNDVFAELQTATLDERRAAYADPAWRAKALEWWEGNGSGFGVRWETFTIGESDAHPELIGRSIAELAVEHGSTPFDTILDLALDEPGLGLRVKVVIANDDTEGVAQLLQDEHCTLGLSDAGAHAGQLCDAPQATDLLGNWVRERGVLTVEQAVRKLTGQQADIFGFEGRGYLRPGAWADVAVFDPATVAPGPVRRVNDFPGGSERLTADQPTGMRHVLVNGVPIVVDAVHTGVTDAGRLVAPAARS
jgi:N-acyl-D-aspartate/D-glutamate deacylase